MGLTVYDGGPRKFQRTALNELLKQIEVGTMKVQLGKVFKLDDDIVEAHRAMEENRAGGEIVVITG